MKNDLDKVFSRRQFILSGVYAGGTALLVGKLYYLQVLNNEKYSILSDKNRTRYLMIDAQRGKILDINGHIIANNRKSYQLMYANYRGNNIEEIILKLAELIILSKTEIEEIYRQIKLKQPVVFLKKNMKWNEVSVIESNIFSLPGLYINHSYKRHYPCKESCAHVVGYLGNQQKHGLSGLELINDNDLIGKPGIVLREVNSHGGIIKESSYVAPIQGNDVRVSINSKVQSFSYRMLNINANKIKSGSVVVINIATGGILTLANFPSYDNNIFTDTLSKEEWKKLNDTITNPLINRCINFKISPGSTFKMVAAISALETGLIEHDTHFNCRGYIEIGNKRFNCWNKRGHGKVKLKEAIAMSCNVYFYNLALKTNIDILIHYAQLFGLGESFNLGFEDEAKVVMPDKKWRSKNMRDRWYIGDTINTIIGHGYMTVTPLHLAVMCARIASGKYVMPHLGCVKHEFDNVEIDNKNLTLVQKAMFDVINSNHGTARGIASSLQHIAGKTGTVQTLSNLYSLREDGTEAIHQNHNYQHNSVFVGYAPYEHPKYAISVTMEYGGGGKNAAKVAQEVLDYIMISGA